VSKDERAIISLLSNSEVFFCTEFIKSFELYRLGEPVDLLSVLSAFDECIRKF
jgi:hypothetical protein